MTPNLCHTPLCMKLIYPACKYLALIAAFSIWRYVLSAWSWETFSQNSGVPWLPLPHIKTTSLAPSAWTVHVACCSTPWSESRWDGYSCCCWFTVTPASSTCDLIWSFSPPGANGPHLCSFESSLLFSTGMLFFFFFPQCSSGNCEAVFHQPFSTIYNEIFKMRITLFW